MKVFTPKQMQKADEISIHEIGIPGIVLMENAALSVVDEIIKMLGTADKKNIHLFAGKGNNGGDAFAVARHLHQKGANVTLALLAQRDKIQGDAKINLDILKKMELDIIELTEEHQLSSFDAKLAYADLIVDGIFGTGLKGRVEGFFEKVVELINGAGKPVISIDIPSGIDGETGEVLHVCIKAHKTVTFALPKLGLLIHPGSEYTGNLIVADIGIPQKVIDEIDSKLHITDFDYVKTFMPKRAPDTNKGDYGKVLILTGSKGMTGAGILTSKAALRTGAGLVYTCVPGSLADIYETSSLESVTVPLKDSGSGTLSAECIDELSGLLQKATVIAVGPGLSFNDAIVKIVASVIEKAPVPLIIDADGINALSKDLSVLKKSKVPVILTPHPGEMSRLTGKPIDHIQKDRLQIAGSFAAQWGIILVLKGSKTLIANPQGDIYINPTGNAGMATGGTGDVLTGIIAGLMGQGVDPFQAAVLGVYLHGAAGDCAASKLGEHGLIAGDLIPEIPYVMKGFIKR
ncbi:MAG: NAD(P)H-hydrate dehydratase [Clostridia bacterium]|nr:NAD(P)H-hydrate dehydratase [Clostridia bacterium]